MSRGSARNLLVDGSLSCARCETAVVVEDHVFTVDSHLAALVAWVREQKYLLGLAAPDT